MKRYLATAAIAVMALVGLTACDEGGTDNDKGAAARESETSTQQGNYADQVAKAPAHKFGSTQTRDTVNFWVDTWGKPGALSYNYIGVFDDQGQYHASIYYVLKGLPVSYCVSLSPTYKYDSGIDLGDYDGSAQAPAPAMDGVYYSGGDCERYYGQDANTGAYVEYKVPFNAFVQTFSQPMTGSGFNTAVQVNGETAE